MPKFVIERDLPGASSWTDAEVRASYQVANEAGQTWHVNFYRDEMRRRESARSEATMRRLTWVIAGLTAVNVAVVVVALLTS